jgi:hypothetical protein
MFFGAPKEYSATGLLVAGTGGAAVPISGCVLTPAAAACTAVLREGGAGGAVVLTLAAIANGPSVPFPVPMVIRDPHLTLTGAGALFYANL